MRIRRKPWARPELAACPFCVDNPAENKGNWAEQFPKIQPMHLELGCGKGIFTALKAHGNQDINFLAIDIKSDILGVAKRNIEKLYNENGTPADNILIFAYNIEQILNVFDEQDQMERIYINFCNPWPKAKQKKKRLTYPRQLQAYKVFLKDQGEIWFKTDDDQLFDESVEYFESEGFTIKYLTRDLHQSGFEENVTTEHEEMFTAQGIPIKFLIAVHNKVQ